MPPEPVVFFMDRSLGKHVVPEALRAAGAHVELHDAHFASDTVDESWIREVGSRGWVILTKDRRIRYRPLERAAVHASGAKMFVVMGGNLSGAEMAAMLAKHLGRMTRLSVSEPAPFIARVTRSGIRIERLAR